MVTARMTAQEDGITAVDSELLRPGHAAVHIVEQAGRAAIVDTGSNSSIPFVLAALEQLDLARESVDYLFLTHVHLDHAGGAGALMRELPNARCAIHPRGARHLAEPSKLVAGSIAVYGEERYRALYGEILPIDVARIFEVTHGARIRLGGRELELIHTPGHALHHYCIVDAANALVFSGDTFGISYRDFDVDGRAFIFPTTTPVHFDPEALCRSVDRLMAYRPRSIFLTHYAEVTELERLARELKERVVAYADLGLRYRDAHDRADKLRHGMFAMMASWLDAHGFTRDDGERHRLLDGDVELNCQGIEVWLDRN
jgi:glyoxylase-like metal-dependent hydrolase (beta-lactamase superfamily II)